jgi:hypothetical protein
MKWKKKKILKSVNQFECLRNTPKLTRIWQKKIQSQVFRPRKYIKINMGSRRAIMHFYENRSNNMQRNPYSNS